MYCCQCWHIEHIQLDSHTKINHIFLHVLLLWANLPLPYGTVLLPMIIIYLYQKTRIPGLLRTLFLHVRKAPCKSHFQIMRRKAVKFLLWAFFDKGFVVIYDNFYFPLNVSMQSAEKNFPSLVINMSMSIVCKDLCCHLFRVDWDFKLTGHQ